MNRLIELALRQRMLVLMLLIVTILAGVVGYANLNIEAYPDPVPPLVEVITQSNGISSEEMERNITTPIEIATTGLPHLKAIRSISLFGLSDVRVQFDYGVTFSEAEQLVRGRLTQLQQLPGGAQPLISPTSPTGEIYRYRLSAPTGYSVMDLKTLQDWVLQRRLKRIPGVIDVNGWGGKLRSYEVKLDRDKLLAHNVTVPQVLAAIGKSDANVGGQTVNFGEQAAIVRGIGLIQSTEAIRNVLVGTLGGTPVLLRDVGRVQIGNLPRLGIAGEGKDDDIVMGIVLMQRGVQSLPTIHAVEQEIAAINAGGVLPPGVKLDRIYDRSDLIGVTTHTVMENLAAGVLLIFGLQWLFLGNFRSAVIVALTIPFALSVAILILTLQGESANLLSLGALDFGLVVDAAVIMVEAIFRRMADRSHAIGVGRITASRATRFSAILHASSDVSRGIFFAAAIIIASFLPLFTLTGIEGHIFGPMAKTYAYAIGGGLVAAFTIAPVLSALLLPDRLKEVDTWLVRQIRRRYEPAVSFALKNPLLTLGTAGIALAVTIGSIMALGVEFLPHLEEGNLYIRATLPPSVSLEAGQPTVIQIRHIIASYPEVERVTTQHGRPDDGTDATGFFNAEFYAPLKPASQWPAGVTKETLTADLQHRLQARFAGIDFEFSQYIEDNVEEATSGVKGANSVKIFGSDLAVIERLANQIKVQMANVEGVADLGINNSLGQPTVRIEVDRLAAARYGLTPDDINTTVAAAIGGQSTGDLYEQGTDRHFPIVVRLDQSQRNDIEAIKRITIGAPAQGGTGLVQVPLSEVAHIHFASGASFIYREHQERYVPIKFSVRGRDLGGTVDEIKRRITRNVVLPPGYHLEWAGDLGNLTNAVGRLEIVVPISLMLILVLLFANFGSIRDTFLAFSVIPMALVGGVLALVLTGTPFSISAAIGFVALFGIATMDGILLVAAFNQQINEGQHRDDAIAVTIRHSMRPVVLTCLAAAIGLLPAALSSGIGSQVQKPLALVVVGGMTLAPILILLVLPVLIVRFSHHHGAHGHAARRHHADGTPMEPE